MKKQERTNYKQMQVRESVWLQIKEQSGNLSVSDFLERVLNQGQHPTEPPTNRVSDILLGNKMSVSSLAKAGFAVPKDVDFSPEDFPEFLLTQMSDTTYGNQGRVIMEKK